MTAQPIDIVALITAVFTGLAALLSAVAGAYAIVAAQRAKRAETVSVASAAVIEKVEANTNSMTDKIAELSRKEGIVEGVERGAADARTLARGQQEGREQTANEAALRAGSSSEEPVPVTTATERAAEEGKDPLKKE